VSLATPQCYAVGGGGGGGPAGGGGAGRPPTPLPQDRTSLEQWYRAHVVGGPTSFLLAAAGYGDFSRAMRRKFVIEISALERKGEK